MSATEFWAMVTALSIPVTGAFWMFRQWQAQTARLVCNVDGYGPEIIQALFYFDDPERRPDLTLTLQQRDPAPGRFIPYGGLDEVYRPENRNPGRMSTDAAALKDHDPTRGLFTQVFIIRRAEDGALNAVATIRQPGRPRPVWERQIRIGMPHRT